jgi:DNA primase
MIDNWGEDKQNLLKKANSVSLVQIANSYGIDLKRNNKICCPFPDHKNGRERTASFCYYPESNSFFCFGCKIGNKPVDFVANMEIIDRKDAIYKILNEHNIFLDLIDDYDDCLELYVQFSNMVRPMIQDGLNLDKYLQAFDIIINENQIKKNQLEKLIYKIKQKIENGED